MLTTSVFPIKKNSTPASKGASSSGAQVLSNSCDTSLKCEWMVKGASMEDDYSASF